ncbi:hypothetical protein BLA29_007730 [Euroglyphus maynei]|uniref:Uncharacterized protein n=1 Tax=Euroglyphus maynei TaxID=6958 RepID=A0A1Y3AZ59_EURMA|nr:hypothetical protein BLA29_007730 [Euroglyphus maynei]
MKTNRMNNETAKIPMDHMDGKNLQRKRQSWEFSPTTPMQNKSSLTNKHPLSRTIRMKGFSQDSATINGQDSPAIANAANVVDHNPMINAHFRL